MKIDKFKIIENCLVKERKDLLNIINKLVIARDESPLPNETRSDTARIQADKMLTALMEKQKELNTLIDGLPNECKNDSDGIELWSYVELTNKNMTLKLILVPEGYGGREIDGIKLVSISTPLGSVMVGTSLGKKINANGRSSTITLIN